jgi:peptidoglycan/LPS O-acetylase OafA/YrhL
MYKIPHRAFPELDALRFFSVLMIVIHHLFSRETVVLRWFSDYGSVGAG